MAAFTHLHVHSEYSLLDGACRIAELPKKAKSLGQNAIAITDHGVMYGVIHFYKACLKEGIKPIIGCEVYVASGSRYDHTMSSGRSYYHLILLCENNTGYHNLCKLVSLSNTEGFYIKPRIDYELLQTYHEGLICLSACVAGEIPQAILSGNYSQAEELALKYYHLFGANHFFLELQNHGLDEERIVNDGLRRLSSSLQIPLVCTNDTHYLSKSDAEPHRILLDIQMNKTVKDGVPLGFSNDEFYLKNANEMEMLFPGLNEALENTNLIADMCNVTFDFSTIHLPRFEPEGGMTPGQYLRQLAFDGFHSKVKESSIVFGKYTEKDYLERIEYELSVIEKMGYSQYYLIVRDFVVHSKRMGIAVGPGRGSGAGSLVAFLVDITEIDSIKYQLLFERFLTTERVSMPDFDVDFCDVRRDDAIAYVQKKYGTDHTALIVTFGTLAARAVIRDVGRVLDMPYSKVDEIAKLIPQALGVTLQDSLTSQSDLKQLYDSDISVRHLIDLAMKLEGMPRHSSIHAAGVVITDQPVDFYVPVSMNNGMQVTQFDMTTIAELGLLKFDFLGLRYLTIIREAEELVQKKNASFLISSIPLNDSRVYEMISQGLTDGVFQLESAGIKKMLTQLKPESFDDIIASIALYRPGPMDSIPNFIECRHGRKKPNYVSPLLPEILDNTYGCIVYQEQVMQIFVSLAGYTMGKADLIRKAIAKKKTEILLEEKDIFIQKLAESGISLENATSLFDDIVSFGKYAFNKCHATPYALLSYQTAYLKCHYPLEYYSSLLSSVLSYPEKIAKYIYGLTAQHTCILPPDINLSYDHFRPEGKSIRFSLLSLRNVGSTFVHELIKERNINGPFASFQDFISRTNPHLLNKKEVESLIKAGCFDSLHVRRSQLLMTYESILNDQCVKKRLQVDGQMDLFSLQNDKENMCPSYIFPDVPELSSKEKLRFEKEVSGLFLSGHPLDEYAEHISLIQGQQICDLYEENAEESEIINDVNSSRVPRFKDKTPVSLCGMIVDRVVRQTKTGEAMAIITLEDTTSHVEVIIFPKTYASCGYLLRLDAMVCIRGTIQIKDEGIVNIICQDATQLFENGRIPVDVLDSLSKNNPMKKVETTIVSKRKKVYVRVPSSTSTEYSRVLGLIEIFDGSDEIVFYDNQEKKYFSSETLRVSSSDFLIQQIREIVGDDNCVIK